MTRNFRFLFLEVGAGSARNGIMAVARDATGSRLRVPVLGGPPGCELTVRVGRSFFEQWGFQTEGFYQFPGRFHYRLAAQRDP